LASPLASLDRKRLRLWPRLFFLALALPTAILTEQAVSQAAFDRLNAPGCAQGEPRQRPGTLGRVEDLNLDLDLRFQKDLAEAPAAAPAGGGSSARNRPPLAQDGTAARAHAHTRHRRG
jgi:hypothetical protein